MEHLSLAFLLFTVTIIDCPVAASLNETVDDLSEDDSLPLGNVLSRDDVPTLQNRRIMKGLLAGNTRPYMVYLRPVANEKNQILVDSHWTCGGVIIDPRYILTSAACIEDVGNFYVVSGTHKFVSPTDDSNECVIKGAKKAVWKCIPKAYFFDGAAFDNIRWMVGDVAIVKVEDDFNFERKIRGCDFVPKMIAYNNKSESLEKSGTVASVAGWGTPERYVNLDSKFFTNVTDLPKNSVELLEADVVLIPKKHCKKNWDERYHFIIDQEMICSKDNTIYDPEFECEEHGVNCAEMGRSSEDYYADSGARRQMTDLDNLVVHTAAHQSPTRRSRIASGGFCENDHGGPLIIGEGRSSMVIGVMSACLTRKISHKCYGPFLYTSVYKYRALISCAIDKSLQQDCRTLLKSKNTQFKKEIYDWRGHRSVQRTSEDTQAKRFQIQRNTNVNPSKESALRQGSIQQRSNSKMDHKENTNTTSTSTEDPLAGIKNVIMRRFYN